MTTSPLNAHTERHLVGRIGWLRATVLGANDGIVSTASLIVGVAAAAARRGEVLLAGVVGLVAGAMSMAAGEYVSVSSQADTESADLSRERNELASSPESELRELSSIYQGCGLDKAIADEVASQLTAKDAIGAHARNELSITHITTARPVQAALTSAATFTAGASLPLMVAWLSPFGPPMIISVSVASLLFLALLGATGAKTGGARSSRQLRACLFGAHSRWRSRQASESSSGPRCSSLKVVVLASAFYPLRT